LKNNIKKLKPLETKVTHKEIEPLAKSTKAGAFRDIDCTYLIQTKTTWDKTQVDTSADFREWALKNHVVSYEELMRGDDNGKEVSAFLFDDSLWVQASVKFFRPKGDQYVDGRKRMDRRLSISITDERVDKDEQTFRNFVAPGCVVFYFENRGYLYLVPIRQYIDVDKQLKNPLLQKLLNAKKSDG
jgi:hypothetical protein